MSNINIFPNQPNKVNISDNQGSITVTEEGHPSVIISIPENNVITVATPGPRGATGADGTDGADGSSVSTGSLLITGSVSSNVLTFEKGDGSTFSLTVDTGSGGTTDTGSLITTASATNNTLTFTKGDSTTFDVIIDTGSGGTTNTGSLLTTASATNNTLTFTKGDSTTFDVIIDTGSLKDGLISSSAQIADEISGSLNGPSGSFLTTASVSNNDVTFTKGDGTTFTLTVDTGSSATSVSTGSLLKTGSVSSNVLTFQKGDGSTFSLTVDTGSGGTTDTGSLLTTASTTNNVLTFTKGDSSTFNVTVDTGSLPNGLLSSSAQIATDISGSFTLLSSSVASDIEDIIDGTQLVGSSSYAITASHALNGGGTTDYISNVNFTDGDLVFTGTGNAFNSSVDLDGRYVLAGGGSGGALASRQEISGSTSTLANEASESLDLTGYRGYALYSIETDRAAWVRLYTNTGSRTSDHSRNYLTDPLPDAGVIAEVITTGAETIQLSPAVIGFNNEGTPTSNIPTLVQNRSGGSASVTVTLTVLQMEA